MSGMKKTAVKIWGSSRDAAEKLAIHLDVSLSEAVRVAVVGYFAARFTGLPNLPAASPEDAAMFKAATSYEGAVETWKPVVGFEGWYSVSDYGRVKSLPRTVTNRLGRQVFYRGTILKASPDKDGYLRVGLRRNGEEFNRIVHRLVAQSFIGGGEGLEINHRNFNKQDNRPNNLEWVTKAANREHTYGAGRHLARVSPRIGRKLTTEKVDQILALKEVESASATGRLFGISHTVVLAIWAGKSWAKHSPSSVPT